MRPLRTAFFSANRKVRPSQNSTHPRLGMEHLEERRLLTSIIKGPYLQQPTPTSMVVMWETDVAAGSRVDYGGDFVEDSTPVTIHEIPIAGQTWFGGMQVG